MPEPMITTSACSGNGVDWFMLTNSSSLVDLCHGDNFQDEGRTLGPQGDGGGIAIGILDQLDKKEQE